MTSLFLAKRLIIRNTRQITSINTTRQFASAKMDGDATAKAMDRGANSAMDNTEMGADAIHEKGHQADPAGLKTTGTGTPAFHKDGAIGSMFKKDGAIGSVGEKVGGPLASDGMVGKNFNPDGKVGGTIHETLGKKPEGS